MLVEIKSRIAVLETLMNNHLKHHENFQNKVIYPLLVMGAGSFLGVIFLIVKVILKELI